MKISQPLIYLITKGNLTSEIFSVQSRQTLEIIEIAVKAGVSMIQIREKNLPTKFLFELTAEAVKIRKDSATKILVNDRADVALAANADGVHLTSASISARIIRRNFPENFVIGTSTHTLEEVLKSRNEGADFTVFSPIFSTPSKEKYGTPQGVEKLSKVVETVKDFPIIALGGINEENFGEVFSVGASGIAAIRLLNNTKNLPEIIKKVQNLSRKNEK